MYQLIGRWCIGTVFQSQWSKEKNLAQGMRLSDISQVILNAPNPEIFFSREPDRHPVRTRIIASSWSDGPSKGFDTYKWMDENLDWSRFEMTFVGNTRYRFKNIAHREPLDSPQLADVLRDHEIYITASRNDPCSNSLIEAVHCGLKPIALEDGGHPEIVRRVRGKTFRRVDEIPALLDELSRVAVDQTPDATLPLLPSMKEVADQYYRFVTETRETADSLPKPRDFGLLFQFFRVMWALETRWHGLVHRWENRDRHGRR